jgi:hygromycin-B 7''-O-kinase
MKLPSDLDARRFDALHDDPTAWHGAMEALLRHLGWQGPWRPAGEGTVLVALLGSEQVLKLYPPFLRDHWAFERGLMARLQGQLSLPTPALLDSGETDEAWVWTRMTQLPGRLLLERWPRLDEPARLALLRRLGGLVREVQALPVGAQARLAPAWSDFLARQRAGCLARQQRTGLPAHLLAQLPAFLNGPLPGGGADPEVLLTGEYTPMNLLVDDADGLSGMFDFGDGLVGAAAYDWLGPLTFLCAGHAARVQAFFSGLSQPLPEPEPLLRLLLLHRYSHLPLQLAGLVGWAESADLPSLARRLLGTPETP